jgi:hypothetical protein
MKTCKDVLSACLFNREHISEEDKCWLDNEANFVDEDAVVDLLDKASNYDQGLECLNSQQKVLLEKLKELGGGIKKVAGHKRKHMCVTTSLSIK